jgi:hypothetical protein
MRSDHRAQLAAVIARFQAQLRELVQRVPPEERARLLSELDPARARARRPKAAASRKPSAPAPRKRRAAAPEAIIATAAVEIPTATAATEDRTRWARRERLRRDRRRVPETWAPQPQAQTETAAPVAAPAEPAAPVATVARPAPAAAPGRGKRARWTRDTIIDELAGWLMTGSPLDPAFVQRHGPAGLVPAARRIFGRFDAALNVAGLHVAKLYPENPAV